MTNKYRGIVTARFITPEDKEVEYRLRYSMNSLITVCDIMGVDDVRKLFENFEKLNNLRVLEKVIYAGLQDQHPDLTEQDFGRMQFGFRDVAKKVGLAMQLAFNPTSDPLVEDDGEGVSADDDRPTTGPISSTLPQ